MKLLLFILAALFVVFGPYAADCYFDRKKRRFHGS